MLIWKKLEILGLETTRFGDFVQLCWIWWNWLVRLIHLIIIMCYLSCVIVNLLGFVKMGFSNFGVFDVSSMLKPILWSWSKIELILTALEHASCVDIVHASYRIVCSILYWAYLQSALGFFFFFLSISSVSILLILSIMVRKTRAYRTSTSSSSPTFESEMSLSEKNQEQTAS